MKLRTIRTAVIMLLLTALSAAVFAYADSDKIEYDSSVYYDSREEAASALRGAMKDRENYVTVAIYERVDEESIKTIIGDVFNMAIEHTGKPDEGDYLKYQFADYKGKAATDLHWGRPVVIIRYVINYYTNAEQEKLTNLEVKSILKELDLKGKSDYQKIRAIHDYLCDNIEYDTEKSGDDKGGTEHTAYGALVQGRSVCQGYAISMYRLLLESGVDCRVIDGEGKEAGGISSAHSWNIVSIGGVYFYVDTTWDDSSGSLEYFLRNRDDFEADHVMSEEYDKDFLTEKYPVSQSGYPADYDTPIKALNKATAALVSAFDLLDAA